jgi:hypothetical protein
VLHDARVTKGSCAKAVTCETIPPASARRAIPAGTWEDVIAPWFDQVLPGAWQRELPSLLVVPTRGQANDIKTRLIAKGSSHLGLQFVTPSSLRALLARGQSDSRCPA